MGCTHRVEVNASVCTGEVQQTSMILHHWPLLLIVVGTRRSLKNSGSHIDASHSRQPLVKGERLVRYEVNAVMLRGGQGIDSYGSLLWSQCVGDKLAKNMSLDMVMHRRQGRQRRQRTAEVQEMTSSQASARRIVTPKGVLLPALCHASATLEGP